jgi:2-hydroxyglutaryl-CoA dehydratase, D-component.
LTTWDPPLRPIVATNPSSGTTRADAYYSSINCSFVKNCFDKALNGDFDFLDGVVFLNGCDHSRRMYDNWRFAKMNPYNTLKGLKKMVLKSKYIEIAKKKYSL